MNIDKETVARLYSEGRMRKEDYETLMAVASPKKNKYNAQKTEIDGRVFDSAAEARRYSELKLLEQAHEIGGLQCQVKYSLDINGVHICNYVADFVYYEHLADHPTVEDCKGMKTPVYRLKKKMMLAIYGFKIKETK